MGNIGSMVLLNKLLDERYEINTLQENHRETLHKSKECKKEILDNENKNSSSEPLLSKQPKAPPPSPISPSLPSEIPCSYVPSSSSGAKTPDLLDFLHIRSPLPPIQKTNKNLKLEIPIQEKESYLQTKTKSNLKQNNLTQENLKDPRSPRREIKRPTPIITKTRPYKKPITPTQIQSPKALTQIQSPKALTQIQSPKALTQIQSPKALTQIQSPKALTQIQSPKKLKKD